MASVIVSHICSWHIMLQSQHEYMQWHVLNHIAARDIVLCAFCDIDN